MPRASAFRLLLAGCVAALACTSGSGPAPGEFVRLRHDSGAERKIVRSGSLAVRVADPAESANEVRRLVEGAGGFVASSNASKGAGVTLLARVPEPQLDGTMDAIAALGSEQSRSTSATDVTEQHSDLSIRLENGKALRDRLQALLARAKDVEDVLAIEKELNRIQSEVETLQASLDRLDSQIALSELSITLQPQQILGPLGYLGYGLWWALSKLFVIR